jgi:hypothetical protein
MRRNFMERHSLLPIVVAFFAIFVVTLIVAGPLFAHEKTLAIDNVSKGYCVKVVVNDITSKEVANE